MVSSEVRRRWNPRAHHLGMGKAHRVSAGKKGPRRNYPDGPDHRKTLPRESGGAWLSGRKRNFEHDGPLAWGAPRDRVRRTPGAGWPRHRSRGFVFLRDVSADRISASSERRFLLFQRLSPQSTRFRTLSVAPPKFDGGTAADSGRVRHGYDPSLAGRTSRNAWLAHRERGEMRS